MPMANSFSSVKTNTMVVSANSDRPDMTIGVYHGHTVKQQIVSGADFQSMGTGTFTEENTVYVNYVIVY